MMQQRIFRVCWQLTNVLLFFAFIAFVYSAIWEFSTRSYLKGFSDAIVPASGNTEEKVEAILQWMAHFPGRRSAIDANALEQRDPEETLNYAALLRVCGTASNAFINLADSSGIQARRLLLLDQRRVTEHVVAEVKIGDHWVVADPLFHSLLRGPDGRLLTRKELQNPAIFREATEAIPGYQSSYTYERTVHVHLSRVPFIGSHLRGILNFVWPSWEESLDWTLLLERASFAMFLASCLLLLLTVAARLYLSWYCTYRGLTRSRLRDHLYRAGNVFLSSSKHA